MPMNDENKAIVVHRYYDEKVPASRYRCSVRGESASLSTEEYDILYELVTTNPFYSKKVELLRKVLNHYQFRKSCSNSPLPLVFKQAVYLLAYELCNGDYYNNAQKQVLQDIGLSLNSFTKWGMHPKNDFNAQRYLQLVDSEPPTIIPLQYQGKKNMALIYLASELSKQIPYNKFLDVFGGSGAVTVGISKKQNAQYFINDADPDQTHIYEILRDNGKDFLKDITEICTAIHKLSGETQPSDIYLNSFPDANTSELIESGKTLVNTSYAETYAKYQKADQAYKKYLEDNPEVPLSENIYQVPPFPTIYNYEIQLYLNEIFQYSEPVNALLYDLSHPEILYARGLFKYFDKVTKEPDSYSVYQRAIALIFQGCFTARARADLSNCITKETLERFCNNTEIWKRVIHEYNYYKVKTFNELDVEVVARKEINCKDTLLYLDSPYIATVGYKSVYGRNEFQALHDKLADFTGYWIFSCRIGVNYKSKPDEIPKNDTTFMDKYENIKFLLNLYSDIAQYVAFIRNKDVSDEYYLVHDGIKEVMFLNFPAYAPDINILRKLIAEKTQNKRIRIDGANKKSVYSIMSYEEFYPLAVKGLDPANW